MSTLGYVLRRAIGIRWNDEHTMTVRDSCYRYYLAGGRRLFRLKICRGRDHEMRYFGSPHVVAVELTRLALLIALVFALVMLASKAVTGYVRDSTAMPPVTVR